MGCGRSYAYRISYGKGMGMEISRLGLWGMGNDDGGTISRLRFGESFG